jgi:hypothetical protein
MLTACGLQEKAFEVDVDDQGRRGALSYFLLHSLTTLSRQKATMSHQALHELLVMHIRSSIFQQTPIRYWKFVLFRISCHPAPMCRGFSVGNKFCQLRLNAGQVHDISKESEFRLYSNEIDSCLRQAKHKQGNIIVCS